jgi:hypothetical protein
MAIERMIYDESLVAMGTDRVARFQITRDFVYIDIFASMEEAQGNVDEPMEGVMVPRHEWQRFIDGAPDL